MEGDSAASEVHVPIKVPEPAEHAPPTLAEPASGPVAEMSGAIHAAGSSDSNPATSAEPTVNGALEDSKPSDSTSIATPTASTDAPAQTSAGEVAASDRLTEAEPVSTAEEVTDANGTPANKKGANGKRKSGSGVPEHKSKKLGKKKSMPKMTHLDAQPGDYFFARLKSYPPWPSIICDEDMLPSTLVKTRPITTKKSDGSYHEAYVDGGKKVMDRTFAVMFLHTNEFAWIPNTDLVPLKPEECADTQEKGKSKALYAAYQVAGEAHDLQHFKTMLAEHDRALQEDEVQKQEKENEKVAKAARKKRKSETKAETEDIEMEDAEEEPAEVKKSSKKRKKEADSDDETVEKTPKTTKLKLTTNKTPATTEKKPKEKASKSKSDKRKSKGAVSDEEMPDAVEEKPEEPVDPVEARKAREKEVLFLRHKLQKGFLSRDQAPQEEEMPQMSNFIKKLENYGDLEVTIIRNTKINKVLKALIKLNSIPKDEEYQFKKRSMDLLSQWNSLLGAEPMDGENGANKENKPTPTSNGVNEEKSEEKAKEESEAKTAQSAPVATATITPKPSTEEGKSADTTKVPDAPASAPSALATTIPVISASGVSSTPSKVPSDHEPADSSNPVESSSAPNVDAALPLAP